MVRLGPVLVLIGVAFLLIPLAEMMGAVGYFLIGILLILFGSVLTLAPEIFDSGAGRTDRTNCPNCGAPNESNAISCEYCETTLG